MSMSERWVADLVNSAPASTQRGEQMPLYKFKCKDCNTIKDDVSQSFTDPAPDCEKCGEAMERMIGLVAFKVWNTNVATQTGEENARMCGLHI